LITKLEYQARERSKISNVLYLSNFHHFSINIFCHLIFIYFRVLSNGETGLCLGGSNADYGHTTFGSIGAACGTQAILARPLESEWNHVRILARS
jgi:hypothetical protein